MAAIIQFKNGLRKFVPFEQGVKVWYWFRGQGQISRDQARYVALIEDIYLDRAKAPESYLRAHEGVIVTLPDNEPVRTKKLDEIGAEVFDERYR